MITSIKLHNFKAFEEFSVSLQDFNVLVGPNNSGKSTILDSLRLLEGAYRVARRLSPKLIQLSTGKSLYGYVIPESSHSIALEHVRHNYNDEPASITYRFSSSNRLILTFSKDDPAILHFEVVGKEPRSATAFREAFPLNCRPIPSLGSLEHDEEIKDRDYVRRWESSHRAPLLFRNIWLYDSERFEEFKAMVESSWEGMSISLPIRVGGVSNILAMFCQEDRMEREVFWAGKGFQIWLQLLTHIVKGSGSDLLVVDEPEIYLHPDLQRRIVKLLRNSGSQVVLATHSVEIINEVDAKEILMVDKSKTSARRLLGNEEIQAAIDSLGSVQNLHLAKLSRNKRVLFVEGNDAWFIERFTTLLGLRNVLADGSVTCLSLGGLTEWEKIAHTEWTFTLVLKTGIRIAALFDRDYRSDLDVEAFKSKLISKVGLLHVLTAKEIENYLLVPRAIHAAIRTRLQKRGVPSPSLHDVEEMLSRISNDLKYTVISRSVGAEHAFLKSTGIDVTTVTERVSRAIESVWDDLRKRLLLIPGKDFVSALNIYLQQNLKVTLTYSAILNELTPNELHEDLRRFLEDLAGFGVDELVS